MDDMLGSFGYGRGWLPMYGLVRDVLDMLPRLFQPRRIALFDDIESRADDERNRGVASETLDRAPKYCSTKTMRSVRNDQCIKPSLSGVSHERTIGAAADQRKFSIWESDSQRSITEMVLEFVVISKEGRTVCRFGIKRRDDTNPTHRPAENRNNAAHTLHRLNRPIDTNEDVDPTARRASVTKNPDHIGVLLPAR
jgi:hypothetical protein